MIDATPKTCSIVMHCHHDRKFKRRIYIFELMILISSRTAFLSFFLSMLSIMSFEFNFWMRHVSESLYYIDWTLDNYVVNVQCIHATPMRNIQLLWAQYFHVHKVLKKKKFIGRMKCNKAAELNKLNGSTDILWRMWSYQMTDLKQMNTSVFSMKIVLNVSQCDSCAKC